MGGWDEVQLAGFGTVHGQAASLPAKPWRRAIIVALEVPPPPPAAAQDQGGVIPALQRLSYAGKNLEDAQRSLEQ